MKRVDVILSGRSGFLKCVLFLSSVKFIPCAIIVVLREPERRVRILYTIFVDYVREWWSLQRFVDANTFSE